jgi:uncharacterized delta-60 repeat protein
MNRKIKNLLLGIMLIALTNTNTNTNSLTINKNTPSKNTHKTVIAGSLDRSFGNSKSGFVVTAIAEGARNDVISGIAIQSDNKIVAAGWSNTDVSTLENFALVRYLPNGNIDTSFGGNNNDAEGAVVTSIAVGARNDYIDSIQIQPKDQKIVVAGSSNTSDDTLLDFALARYNTDGTLDTETFGGNNGNAAGTVVTSIATGARNDEINAMEIQLDGKIVVAGYSNTNDSTLQNFALARYLPNGTLDNSFGSDKNGVVVTSIAAGARNDMIWAMKIQPKDQKIVVAGYSNTSDDTLRNFALARYNTDGTLDTETFGGNNGDAAGTVVTSIATGARNDEIWAMDIQLDGKIVVAGYSNTSDDTLWDFALARYNTDGTLDATFGGNNGDAAGTVVTAIAAGARDDVITAMEMQADNKIIVTGYSNISDDTLQDFVLARYLTNGTLDNSFGSDKNGVVVTPIAAGARDDIIYAMKIQPSDGKIVVAGFSNTDDDTIQDFALARYLNDIHPLNIISSRDNAGIAG